MPLIKKHPVYNLLYPIVCHSCHKRIFIYFLIFYDLFSFLWPTYLLTKILYNSLFLFNRQSVCNAMEDFLRRETAQIFSGDSYDICGRFLFFFCIFYLFLFFVMRTGHLLYNSLCPFVCQSFFLSFLFLKQA